MKNGPKAARNGEESTFFKKRKSTTKRNPQTKTSRGDYKKKIKQVQERRDRQESVFILPLYSSYIKESMRTRRQRMGENGMMGGGFNGSKYL